MQAKTSVVFISYRLACSQLSEKQKELTDLQAETIKVIRGESRLSIDLLNELVAKAQEEIHRLSLSSEEARSSLEEVQHSAAQEEQEMNQLHHIADFCFALLKLLFQHRRYSILLFLHDDNGIRNSTYYGIC